MKKFVDRCFFSRFSWQLVFSILLIALFSVGAAYVRLKLDSPSGSRAECAHGEGPYQTWSWGFRQVASSSEVIKSIKSLDDVKARLGKEKPSVAQELLGLTLMSWLMGIAVFSFITGAIVNFIRNRQRAIESGRIRYGFRDHGLVVGWDFQGVALVRSLLDEQGVSEVLIVSEQDAKSIRKELKKVLPSGELSRVFVYNGLIADRALLRAAWPERSRVIAVLGDSGRWDRDGGNLFAERLLHDHVKENRADHAKPIRLYLHLEDPLVYGRVRAKSLPAEKDGIFDVAVFNFYESWVWRCWSEKNSNDGSPESPYLPIRHRPGTDRVELFVLGAGQMGQSFVEFALVLMNYGVDRRHCRVTVFDDRRGAEDFLPKADILAELPETEVVFVPCSGGSAQADAIMLEAARREDTSVTVVIAHHEPVAAIRAYAALSTALRRCDISVLLRQSTPSANCPDKDYVKTDGERAVIRYFGMTDVLPWLSGDRRSGGQAIGFYYDVRAELRDLTGRELAGKARSLWNGPAAEKAWSEARRWGKWSSVSSGDSFREKAFAFPDCASNPASCTALLHAEHNRWWTERLLQGWRYAPVRDNDLRLHPLMVKFDDLDEASRSIDKINLAAMFQCGFLNDSARAAGDGSSEVA